MIDGTMTVSDLGGKSILEEAVNTMKPHRTRSGEVFARYHRGE